MEKLTIYFHVGTGKTGSSVIQNFLNVNRHNLFTNHNCLYPNVNDRHYQSGRLHNHCEWFTRVSDTDETFITEIKKIIEYAKKRHLTKIVFSCEGWLLNKKVPPKIKLIVDSDKSIEVKIVGYLRRVDYWVESAWKQWGMKINEDYHEYIHSPGVWYKFRDFRDSLELWESCIGKDNIIIRAYEQEQLPKGLLYDFLFCLGIDYEKHSWEKNEATNEAVNKGFNRDVLEILHTCRDLYVNKHDNHLFELFFDLLGESFQKQPFENLSILSPTERLEIIEDNLPFEQEIARRYMGREDGKIFLSEMPNPNDEWAPYQGLTLEKTIPVLIKMIEENNRLIKQNTLGYQIKQLRIFRPIKRILRTIRSRF